MKCLDDPAGGCDKQGHDYDHRVNADGDVVKVVCLDCGHELSR